jgi:hypothetical protein
VTELAERATNLLCEGQVTRSEARALGAAFAGLRLGPEGWGRIEQSLMRELTAQLPAQITARLQPLLAPLTGRMTAGFLNQTKVTISQQQEQMRQAYIDSLERAERELRIRDAAMGSSPTASVQPEPHTKGAVCGIMVS